jgi:hypothetical protein
LVINPMNARYLVEVGGIEPPFKLV